MGKNLPANAGDATDMGSIPGTERFSGGGNGNPLQYSCLENSMDRGAWQAIVHGAAKLDTTDHEHDALYSHRGQISAAPFYLDKARCGYLQRKYWLKIR